MAYIELNKVRNLDNYDRYIMNDRGVSIEHSGPEGLEDSLASSIRDEHARTDNKRMEVLAVEIIQSWHPKESKLFSAEKYNEMGRELAEQFAPGHLVWVTTHTDKNHVHNHITICTVHSETGKALARRRGDFQRLHEIGNKIAKENGLMLNPAGFKDAFDKYPYYMQKLDFARAASTSFDEYVGQLNMLGVNVTIENKNIVYGSQHSKWKHRAKHLGENFEKDGLIKAFKENDERFAKNPEIRKQILNGREALLAAKPENVGRPKNYEKFTKLSRRDDKTELPAIFDQSGGVLYSEMKKARSKSILEYCKENKIGLVLNDKGQTVLRGREFVVVSENEWRNTRRGHTGSIIDFVAIHDRTNPLRAVAKINGNSRLLLLEQVMGDYRKGYQSFFIPKPPPSLGAEAAKTFGRFMDSKGIKGTFRDAILKKKGVHIGNNGSVWLLGKDDDSATEYREKSTGQWEPKRHGNPHGVFLEVNKKSKKLAVFSDPFQFFQAEGRGNVPKDASVIVLFGEQDSNRKVIEFLAFNPQVNEVHHAAPRNPKTPTLGEQLFGKLKLQLDPFAIQIKSISLDEKSKARGRGPDLSF